jgi:hypothetical protein
MLESANFVVYCIRDFIYIEGDYENEFGEIYAKCAGGTGRCAE